MIAIRPLSLPVPVLEAKPMWPSVLGPVCLFRSKNTGYRAASLVYLLEDQEHSQVMRRTPEKPHPPSLHWTSLGTNRISSKPGLSIALYCLGMDFAIHLRMLIFSIALSGITPILLLSHHFLPLWQPTWKPIGHVDNCSPLFYWEWIPCGKAWTKNSTYLLWALNSWYQILCE